MGELTSTSRLVKLPSLTEATYFFGSISTAKRGLLACSCRPRLSGCGCLSVRSWLAPIGKRGERHRQGGCGVCPLDSPFQQQELLAKKDWVGGHGNGLRKVVLGLRRRELGRHPGGRPAMISLFSGLQL